MLNLNYKKFEIILIVSHTLHRGKKCQRLIYWYINIVHFKLSFIIMANIFLSSAIEMQIKTDNTETK